MKKLLSIFFAVFVVFVFLGRLNAQEEPFNFERAYKDYIYNYDLYRKAYASYQLARSEYLQAKTLTAKTKARDATGEMIKTRDQVVITYLTALRMKLSESVGISDTIREGFYSRIDSEADWHTNHRELTTSAATLEDLFQDSNDAWKRFVVTEALAYEIHSEIMVGKVGVLREETRQVFGELRDFVSKVRQEGKKDTQTIERWILEIENRISRSEEKETTARKLVTELPKFGSSERLSQYNQVQYRLEESLQYLKEANSYLRETVKEIKTAD